MYKSLSQFYTSKEWRSFRQMLINERTNRSDGMLYDEHSGEPLLKSYDIVLHHKVPLTMQNVNDFDVSLNPENIMIVSHKSHNEIHKRFGYIAQRKVYYVYGAPCSGKSTFVNSIKSNSDIVFDIDNIWQALTSGKRYEKPDALKTNVFAVRDLVLDMISRKAGKWEKAFVIEGGAYKGERERKIKLLNAEPIFIEADKETCLKRLANDKERTAKQKEQWKKFIDEWFADYME